MAEEKKGPVAPDMTKEEEARAGSMQMERGMSAPFSLRPRNLTEAMEMAKLLAKCDLVPKDYIGKPGNILIAVQMGQELGLSPKMAIDSIAIINGRATLWGDAVLGLVKVSGLLDDSFGQGGIEERLPAEAWELKEGCCKIKLKNFAEPLMRTFSYQEALDAGLVARAKGTGTWATYPGRMLQMRARSWVIRDACPEVLKGLKIAEEERDILDVEFVTVSRPARKEPPLIEAGAVDGFVAGHGGAPGTPQRSAGSSGSVGGGSAPAQKGKPWKGKIDKVEAPKSGTSNGRKWKFWPVIGADGTRFAVFSDTDAAVAGDLQRSGEMADIQYSTDGAGRNSIDSISPA